MVPAYIRQFFVKQGITSCPVLAAVSGGFDSTALLLGLAELRGDGFRVVAGHVNHHLRGSDSDADEALVRSLCARLDIPLQVADGTLEAEVVRVRGVEAAARAVRYERLTAMRERSGVRFVATAHQKDDQAETVLIRLLTGSGIAGLRGIHPLRDDGFVRPLLDVTRAEIEEFLSERGVTARLDRSNDDPRFLRNRVRVFLRETGGADVLAAVSAQARALWPLLEKEIDGAEAAHAVVERGETRFTSWPQNLWLRGALLLRHIRRLDPHARDFDAERIAAEVETHTRVSVTRNLELVRKGACWILRTPPARADAFEAELAEDHPARIASLGITLRIQRASCATPESRNPQLIQLPPGGKAVFTVRSRRPGDRFQPLGLHKPKKLKDFLIDRKIAAEIRDRLPLLVWNEEIVWVAGVEVSERFKVTDPPGVLYEVWTDEDRDRSDLQL